MDFTNNKEQIKEIILNPRFCTKDAYEILISEGFSVRWMTDNETNQTSIFSVITVDND